MQSTKQNTTAYLPMTCHYTSVQQQIISNTQINQICEHSVTIILEEHERAKGESMMRMSQIISAMKDKNDPVLTGRAFAEYFVIFGPATLPRLAACTRTTIIIVKQL